MEVLKTFEIILCFPYCFMFKNTIVECPEMITHPKEVVYNTIKGQAALFEQNKVPYCFLIKEEMQYCFKTN